jgi:hypothetical protein
MAGNTCQQRYGSVMPSRRSTIAVLGSLVALSLAVSCSHDDPPRAKSAPPFPDAFKTVPAGGYRVVAAVPAPGATTDERARLLAPVQVLPAPDGGLVVVTQNDISTLTTITRDGSLKPYLLDSFPKYADGTSPAAPTSAYVENDKSLVLTTRTGEIVRMTNTSVRRLGTLPQHTGATLITNPKGGIFIQQGNKSYRAAIQAAKVTVTSFTVKGTPKSFALQAFSDDGNRTFSSDGKSVIAVSTTNKTVFNKVIKRDGSVSSIISDEHGGAWAGDNEGGITHISADGAVSQFNESNAIADDCTSQHGRAPLGAVYSMLLRGSQLYAVDKQCNRIVAFGLQPD